MTDRRFPPPWTVVPMPGGFKVVDAEQLLAYRASDPHTPTTFRRGERANAEPALPGWSMAVDDLFPD